MSRNLTWLLPYVLSRTLASYSLGIYIYIHSKISVKLLSVKLSTVKRAVHLHNWIGFLPTLSMFLVEQKVTEQSDERMTSNKVGIILNNFLISIPGNPCSTFHGTLAQFHLGTRLLDKLTYKFKQMWKQSNDRIIVGRTVSAPLDTRGGVSTSSSTKPS